MQAAAEAAAVAATREKSTAKGKGTCKSKAQGGDESGKRKR